MALLLMIGRKMRMNKWLELSLLAGLVLSVALASSIPIYTEAVLQRMLIKDMENVQRTTGQYPGIHYTSAFMGATSYWDQGDYKPEEREQVVNGLDRYLRNEAAGSFGIPVTGLVRDMATDFYTVTPFGEAAGAGSTNKQAELAARTGLYEHIRLIDGRLPAKEPNDGIYEALVVESSLRELNMVLGNVFVLGDGRSSAPVKVKPVGVIGKKDDADPYWNKAFPNYSRTFFIDDGLFASDFLSGNVLPAATAAWLFVFDYARLHLSDVHRFIRTSERVEEAFGSRFGTYHSDAPAVPTLRTYLERESRLRTMLWSLYVPVMMMLAFYLYMVAHQMAERQKAEIAVLRSRGASRRQVLSGYVIESLLLGGIALAAGPPVGLLLTRLLGASNGFLEFVNRAALPASVSADAYRYAAGAVVCSVIMTLLPVWIATRASIVGYKQQSARRQRRSFWHRFCLDIVLVAVALYGLRMFTRQRGDLLKTAAGASGLSVDPLLFLAPALFILGAGLLALRLYPWAVRLLYRLGRKRWSPVLYSTLIQVGRSGTQYQIVMVFLIMTTAAGLYSASAARTLNRNIEETILYRNGADAVLRPEWVRDAPSAAAPGPPGTASAAPPAAGTERVRYLEPPFQPYAQLPGVEHAAKVMVKSDASVTVGKERSAVRLLGIHTADFGRTAWMREGLLDHHFYDYLNVMAQDPKAVLISRSLADRGIKPGDVIHIDWGGVDAKPFTVYGVIDYWPTFNPNPAPDPANPQKTVMPMLVVGHLAYMQLAMAVEPYEIWVKWKPGADRQAFYDAIAERSAKLTSMTDTQEERILARNDPFQLAVNGVMTLGFLIAAAVSLFGFLLYWVLSLSGRVMQFGILRAMGLSFPRLLGMLAAEQALTSGAAVAIGGVVGSATSRLFVPFFQLSFRPSEQVPPFRVVFESGDSLRLYLIVTVMLMLGLLILGWLVSRINIHQAVKLGED